MRLCAKIIAFSSRQTWSLRKMCMFTTHRQSWKGVKLRQCVEFCPGRLHFQYKTYAWHHVHTLSTVVQGCVGGARQLKVHQCKERVKQHYNWLWCCFVLLNAKQHSAPTSVSALPENLVNVPYCILMKLHTSRCHCNRNTATSFTTLSGAYHLILWISIDIR